MTITDLPPAAPAAVPAPDALAGHIRAALGRLATNLTSDAVAVHLGKLGIRGRCGDPGQCAVAAYLGHAVPGLADLAFYIDSGSWSAFVREPGQAHGVELEGPTPPVVGRFIRRFDAGDYAGLRTADSPPYAIAEVLTPAHTSGQHRSPRRPS